MEAQLQALAPFSAFLRTVDGELSTALQARLPAPWTPEVAGQLLAFCQGGDIVYTPSFLRLATYFVLPLIHERIDADARRYGDQDHIRAVVEAGIGYDDAWGARHPAFVEKIKSKTIARRGLYYMRPALHTRWWAKYGHVDVLGWAREDGRTIDTWASIFAAISGHLHVLQWLHDHGYGWDEYVCAGAATGGHLHVLQWLRAKGCPWDECTCLSAAQAGHLHIIQWARGQGCPWNMFTYLNATVCGHTTLVEWLVENGCQTT